jgi:sigma-E factor negative regulatory protein RseA
MTSHISDEQLSAYTDDEATVNGLKLTKEQRQTLMRYHLMKASIQKQIPSKIEIDIAKNVASALSKEPIIKSKVVKLPSNRSFAWKKNVRQVVQFSTQFAVAASVAALCIVNLSPDDEASVSQAPMFQTQPIFHGTTPVSLQIAPQSQSKYQTMSKEEQKMQEEKINRYLYDYAFRERLYQQESKE